MTVADNIKSIRKEKGLTQKQLGEKCGMSESTLRQYELGFRNPKIETIQKIADALEVPVIDLIGIDGIMGQTKDILKKFNGKPESWGQIDYRTGEELPEEQTKLLNLYNNLNEKGKNKAIERVEELNEIPRYTKKDKN